MESGNLVPEEENSLTPLSWNGLCDAEMTMPAENPWRRTSHAIPGVGITPAEITRQPPAISGREILRAIHGADSRVSIPSRI